MEKRRLIDKGDAMKSYNVKVNGVVYEVEVEEVAACSRQNQPKNQAVDIPNPASAVKAQAPVKASEEKEETGANYIKSPMPGKIFKVSVRDGDDVKSGDVILVLEAMKMENEIVSQFDGKVKLLVREGDSVDTNQNLAKIG